MSNAIVKWAEHFMRNAYLAASMSKDTSTQIGAVNVIDKQILTTGFNGICRGVDDTVADRNASPEKYFWFEHAERNSCYAAAREGIKLRGATMYTQAVPCADCCRALIQSGIAAVIIHRQWTDIWTELQGNQWIESQARSEIMLNEAGIHKMVLDKQLGLTALIRGNLYQV